MEGVRLLEDAVAAGVEIETVFYTDRLLARERGRQLLQECQGREAAATGSPRQYWPPWPRRDRPREWWLS